MHTLRKKMQIIFQDPYSSLDPRMTVYDLIGEGLAAHKLVSSRIELEEKVEAIMEKCGLFPEQALRFPHQDVYKRQGISNVNLSNLKTGKVKAVRFSTLDAICDVLDCQPGDILEYTREGSLKREE